MLLEIKAPIPDYVKQNIDRLCGATIPQDYDFTIEHSLKFGEDDLTSLYCLINILRYDGTKITNINLNVYYIIKANLYKSIEAVDKIIKILENKV